MPLDFGGGGGSVWWMDLIEKARMIKADVRVARNLAAQNRDAHSTLQAMRIRVLTTLLILAVTAAGGAAALS